MGDTLRRLAATALARAARRLRVVAVALDDRAKRIAPSGWPGIF